MRQVLVLTGHFPPCLLLVCLHATRVVSLNKIALLLRSARGDDGTVAEGCVANCAIVVDALPQRWV